MWNRLTDTENKLVVTKGKMEEGEGQTRDLGLTIAIYNIAKQQGYILQSTGNYTHYLVITHSGAESEGEKNPITVLYTRNEHNIVNQLYFSK